MNFIEFSYGGNILINMGPTKGIFKIDAQSNHFMNIKLISICLKEGTISPIFEQRLRDLGSWMNINGEAIYGTQPWIYQNDTINPDVW